MTNFWHLYAAGFYNEKGLKILSDLKAIYGSEISLVKPCEISGDA